MAVSEGGVRTNVMCPPESPLLSGVNGEITYVNVTVNNKGPLNAEMLTVITQSGTTKHYLPLLVAN